MKRPDYKRRLNIGHYVDQLEAYIDWLEGRGTDDNDQDHPRIQTCVQAKEEAEAKNQDATEDVAFKEGGAETGAGEGYDGTEGEG